MPSPQDSADLTITGSRYLIAAGTSKYPNFDDADLSSVKDDIKSITASLTDESNGYKQVLPELGNDPTSNQLRESLSDWFASPERQPTDQVIFYYSGHGETHQGRHYLLTSDSTEKQLSSKAFPAEDLIRYILDSPIQQAMIILDTCYSGQGITDLSSLANSVANPQEWDKALPYGFIFIAAARKKEEAAEGAFANAFAKVVKNPIGQYL